MNKNTLDKLKNNPHYKLNEKQKREVRNIEKKPMVEFGDFNRHSNKFKKHSTNNKKLRRVRNKK